MKTEYLNYNPSEQMDFTEMCNWFSLINGLKFINNHANDNDIPVSEDDLDQRALMNYISSVSGDLQSFKNKGGIPFKYSLDPTHEESKNIEEIYLE